LFSLGFSKMIGRGPRSSCAMANSSGWGARNSDGSTNTMFTSADGFSSAFVCLGRHSILGGAPLFPLRSPNLLREIRTRFPQHVKILCFCVFEVAQALYSALLRLIEPVRTPPWAMVPVFFLWLGISPGWPPHMIVLTCPGPQTPEHRCLVLLVPSRPALRAIIYSRQSAHAGVPTVPEERAVPVVSYSLAPSQHP